MEEPLLQEQQTPGGRQETFCCRIGAESYNSTGRSKVTGKQCCPGIQCFEVFRKKSEEETDALQRASFFIIHHEEVPIKGNSPVLQSVLCLKTPHLPHQGETTDCSFQSYFDVGIQKEGFCSLKVHPQNVANLSFKEIEHKVCLTEIITF